ncbi:UTP--glucose-1-phosphate uridylyltransferase-like isoform X3 [Oopsacas minuta]|uniref:UTP--glucose-1-phosphate uridylyltransferase n=1 Tax=Oopsacas minuta TaxID=111878 RepID=A0AAV7JYI2_9METZ|nr:UTP--glucose-1-phosphate uridylyltransferase-like isoform X3 [Oopsacas minuta]
MLRGDSHDTSDSIKRLTQYCQRLEELAPLGERPSLNVNFKHFLKLFTQYLENRSQSLTRDWVQIKPIPSDELPLYTSLSIVQSESFIPLLDKLVVVKLNGGLGTSMGCEGPKSLITVRNDMTFLDIVVKQIQYINSTYGSNIPLVLMNSFNTDQETKRIEERYKSRILFYTFCQSKYPRLEKETLLPLVSDITDHDISSWYPPGHGDFYQSYINSGLCDEFLKMGKEYLFISNIDNLGATVDLKILNYMHNQSNTSLGSKPCEFLMEVTDKTRSDVKGGTLVYDNGVKTLLEIAQVPKQYVDEFVSVHKFKIFNTNNLWVRMSAIKRLISNGSLHMEPIVNMKTLENGLKVIQLENAIGAAIKCFDGAVGLNVPRSRFLPVKTTSDLLSLLSDLYCLESSTGVIYMNPLRSFPSVPLVKLGYNHFGRLKEFLERFEDIPQMLELDHLTVSGDIRFGKNVTLKGTVIIIANPGERIDIPMGSTLENKVISGNLRVLDH